MKKASIVLLSAMFCSLLLLSSCAFGREGNSLVITSVWIKDGHDIVASCAIGKEGAPNRLNFTDKTTNKDIKIEYLSPEEVDDVKELYFVEMQSFNGLFVVTLETATGFLVKAFLYDEESKTVKQIVSDGGRLQPELIYYGDSDMPAIGIPRLSNDSRLEQRIICGEDIYVFNKRKSSVDVRRRKWPFFEKVKGKYPSDLSCEG